ncbi:hypothetical protein OUZ56_011893 [Daphnia magna]|uniref:Retrotransposon gag domain-containing protein n=1 Tax=Daphnia magna TaxID=35525 RepID=A0ABQ9Z1G0_9CRUS|nr:hypothetical protein OUZ56_011893 [Daphnia magna]
MVKDESSAGKKNPLLERWGRSFRQSFPSFRTGPGPNQAAANQKYIDEQLEKFVDSCKGSQGSGEGYFTPQETEGKHNSPSKRTYSRTTHSPYLKTVTQRRREESCYAKQALSYTKQTLPSRLVTRKGPPSTANIGTLASTIFRKKSLSSSSSISGSISHPGFVASTPVNPPSSGQQNPHWLNTQPPSTPHPGIPSTSSPSSVTSVTIDDKIRRAQQEQAMQAFGSVTIFCDRQRSGRFDDWAAHLESALDLGNFEEARKLRLMRSKLYGEAAEEFDTFKLDNPIRSQEYAAVKARLFKLFHSSETRSERSVEFHNMKREPVENMRRYANRIRKAFHKTYPMDGILDSGTAATREQMMMDRFLEGLPSDVQVPLKYKKFALFETIIDRAEVTALAIEESQTRVRIHAAYSSTNAPTHQNERTSVLEALNRLSTNVDQNATTHNAELQQSLAEMKRQLAQKPSQVGGRQRDPNVTEPEAFKRAALFCEFHNTRGFHAETDCFTKLQQKNELCRLCRNIGHRHNFCLTIRNPRPPPPSGHYANTPATPTGIMRSQAEN